MTKYNVNEEQVRDVVSCALEGMVQDSPINPKFAKEYQEWDRLIESYFCSQNKQTEEYLKIKNYVDNTVSEILSVEKDFSIDEAISHYEKAVSAYEKMEDKTLFKDRVFYLGYFRYKKKHYIIPSQTDMTLIEKLALSNCLTLWMERDGKKLYWINKNFKKDNIRSALGLSNNEQIPWKQIEAYQQIMRMPKIENIKYEALTFTELKKAAD